MVHDLYGLSIEEIQIVETSFENNFDENGASANNANNLNINAYWSIESLIIRPSAMVIDYLLAV